MTWLPRTAAGTTPLDRVFGLRPAAYARFRELYDALWSQTALDPVVLELCRLRVATLLGCDGEPAGTPGLSAARVAALPQWPTSPLFDEAERACLGFAEQYVMDPHGVTDEHFTALQAHLAPAAVATLVLGLAVFEALARFRVALGVEPALGASP